MTQKYFIGKCGGRDCQFLTNDNICVLDGDCENCPHGKTIEEMADSLRPIIDNIPFDIKEECHQRVLCKMIIKALLGDNKTFNEKLDKMMSDNPGTQDFVDFYKKINNVGGGK